MIRQTIARVDLEAIRSNFRAIAAFLRTDTVRPPEGVRPPTPQIIAVVKANAYGHGAGPVGLALEQAGARMLACADIEEAVVLREAGVRAGILVFGALSVSDVGGIFEYDLVPTISTPTAARAVETEAARRGVRIGYHLKIDTGMHRLGFRHDNLRRTLPDLLASPHLRLDAVYTHFATADDAEHELMAQQRAHFDEAVDVLETLGAGGIPRHAANSAALLRDERVWYDYVRPGLLLYGVTPPPLATTLPLAPAMEIRSRVVALKGLRPGEHVGYGARYTADSTRTIAVVPAGYADGLDLRLAGRGHVLVAGRRAPIIGSVCMDMITIDVTGLPVRTGDEVVILGRQGADRVDVREMAAAAGTIPWEILCRVGARIERIYNRTTAAATPRHA
jgi:alanine racemase